PHATWRDVPRRSASRRPETAPPPGAGAPEVLVVRTWAFNSCESVVSIDREPPSIVRATQKHRAEHARSTRQRPIRQGLPISHRTGRHRGGEAEAESGSPVAGP